ncbi:MAG TPA: ATP-binding protein [Streptosporangiaceae bacterium]
MMGLGLQSIRSVERRRWSADLVSSATAGLVLHGVGGIGKSTLAAGITERVGRLEPGRVTAVITGEVSPDTFLAGLAAALRGGQAADPETVREAGRAGLPWAHRLALLRERVLGRLPVLVVLDNFDENLSAESGRWTVRDPALGGLLASWADPPHLGRLLITCRQPFTLPGQTGQAFGLRRLGPLSRSEAGELAASLPALAPLGAGEIDRAWRLLAGHPRDMEYLNALLASGRVRFPDVARRLSEAIRLRTGRPVPPAGPDAPVALSPEAADAIALGAGSLLLGELFDQLSADARALLIGASVYRAPVGRNVQLLPPGPHRRAAEVTRLAAEAAAAGLLTAGPAGDPGDDPPSVFVHRWTASELHRRLAEARHGQELADAHRRAAEYWRWRIAAAPHDSHAVQEARYHLRQADDPAGDRPARHASQPAPAARRAARGGGSNGSRASLARRLRPVGLVAAVVIVTAGLTAAAAGAFSARTPDRPAASTRQAVTQAAAVRGGRAALRAEAALRERAAAWVAGQVGRGPLVACDPAMCSALLAHGLPRAGLLMLRPGTAASLRGADVAITAAADRGRLGRRLASEYAPEVIASFGSGPLRIDVRAVAPGGAAAYRTAITADLAARREAGSQLLLNPRIGVTPAARGQLAAGQVDTRLLLTLAAMAATEPVRVVAFADSGPGAGPDLPLRSAEVAVKVAADAVVKVAGPAGLKYLLAFVSAQQPPYRPARSAIVAAAGSPVLSIEFTAPSPLGLMAAQPLT